MYFKTFLAGLAFTPLLLNPVGPLAQEATAEGLKIKANVAVVQGGYAQILVTITNNTDQVLNQLGFKCVFTKDNEPVGVSQGFVQRLGPGKSDTVQVNSNTGIQSDGYSCRPTQAMIYF